MLITAAPGPDNLMVLGMGMSSGRKQGIAFGLGCAAGCLSHTVLAVLGVSAMVAASPMAFAVLKAAGGTYLAWLGINLLRSRGGAKAQGAKAGELSVAALFFRGVFANAINPKVALFFLSFLPQFVIPANGQAGWQMAALGLAFTVQAALLFGLLAYFAGSVGRWLYARPMTGATLDRMAGVLFLALGLRLILFH